MNTPTGSGILYHSRPLDDRFMKKGLKGHDAFAAQFRDRLLLAV
jgi:hypothetical protein